MLLIFPVNHESAFYLQHGACFTWKRQGFRSLSPPSMSPGFTEGGCNLTQRDIFILMRKETLPSGDLPNWCLQGPSGALHPGRIGVQRFRWQSPSTGFFTSSLDLWQVNQPLWTSLPLGTYYCAKKKEGTSVEGRARTQTQLLKPLEACDLNRCIPLLPSFISAARFSSPKILVSLLSNKDVFFSSYVDGFGITTHFLFDTIRNNHSHYCASCFRLKKKKRQV